MERGVWIVKDEGEGGEREGMRKGREEKRGWGDVSVNVTESFVCLLSLFNSRQ